jgi:hypothetical protein
MAKITWNKEKEGTQYLFGNGGIILTGRNLNLGWTKRNLENQTLER